MGAGPQDNESALEQAKDEQVCNRCYQIPIHSNADSDPNRSRTTSDLRTRAPLAAISPSRTNRSLS
jgi:hypothetical protein